MNPLRLDYLRSILAELRDSPINRQFSPICYFHAMRLWAAQWHPRIESGLDAAAAVRPPHAAGIVAVAGVLVSLFFWLGRRRYRAAVGASIFVQGAAGMVVQVVLILSFQILEGFAYQQLALIIACFMAGLALGTLWVAGSKKGWTDNSRSIQWFTALQAAVTAFPLLVLLFLAPAGETLRAALSSLQVSGAFAMTSLAAGILGGAHFSLAALVVSAAGARLERSGGYLYALDLAGAAGGAVAVCLLVLPLYGVSGALILISVLSLVCLVAVLRRPG